MVPRGPAPTDMKLRFSKMHGLGNDFMVVDLVTQTVELNSQCIRRWGDRRTGVGFDQMLAALPPTNPEADFRYRIFNADGSEAEQCGNGARCLARFVRDHRLTPKRNLTLETATGLIGTELLENGQVRVDMGAPSLEPACVPFCPQLGQPCGDGLGHALDIGGQTIAVVPVSIGNPHAVVFVDQIVNAPVAELGAAIQRCGAFPEGVNVGFLQVVEPDFARLRVFERGVGETQACGSGACAAMVAGNVRGRLAARATISLLGGELKLHWPGLGCHVSMAGPATSVFEGQLRA